MHWLDTTLLAALSLGAALGLVSGLFWQLARIASFAISVYATILLHEPAVGLLRQTVMKDTDAGLVKAAAYLAVFLMAYLLLFLITRLLRAWIRATDLAPMDRLLGAGLGLVKVAVLVALACWSLPRWPHPGPKEWHDASTLAPYFSRTFDLALTHVPDAYKQPVLDSFEQWRSTLSPPVATAK